MFPWPSPSCGGSAGSPPRGTGRISSLLQVIGSRRPACAAWQGGEGRRQATGCSVGLQTPAHPKCWEGRGCHGDGRGSRWGGNFLLHQPFIFSETRALCEVTRRPDGRVSGKVFAARTVLPSLAVGGTSLPGVFILYQGRWVLHPELGQ